MIGWVYEWKSRFKWGVKHYKIEIDADPKEQEVMVDLLNEEVILVFQEAQDIDRLTARLQMARAATWGRPVMKLVGEDICECCDDIEFETYGYCSESCDRIEGGSFLTRAGAFPRKN